MLCSRGTVYPAGTIHRRMTKNQVTKLYSESGMEVAVHGLMHPHLEQLPINLCLEDIAKDRENLEEQFGVIVRGMAYPYGSFKDTVIECMKAAGIVYPERQFQAEVFQSRKIGFVLRLPVITMIQSLWNWTKKFAEDNSNSSPWLFYLWGHSYEFEAHDNWNVIENFAEYIGCRDNIWYATNIEIYEYVTAYRQLVFSMDAKRVFNTTAHTLYFEKMEKIIV